MSVPRTFHPALFSQASRAFSFSKRERVLVSLAFERERERERERVDAVVFQKYLKSLSSMRKKRERTTTNLPC